MKITSIVEEESEGEEIVFVTKPPITKEMVDLYNEWQKGHSDAILKFRNGEVVATHRQYVLWAAAYPGGDVAATLAGLLTEAEDHINTAKANDQKLRKARLAGLTKVFGVPVVKRNEIGNVEGAYR